MKPFVLFFFTIFFLAGCGDDDTGVATPSARCLDECELNIGIRDPQTCTRTLCGTKEAQ